MFAKHIPKTNFRKTYFVFLRLYIKLVSPASQACSGMWFWEGVAIKILYVLSTLGAEANAS